MKVYLVGAGPGDPELITVKGRRILGQASCVLYDNLANHELLDFAPKSAEKIYVGKKKSVHAMSQDEICALLIDRAKTCGNVVRLKGGDPYIFGRGGEEAEALYDAGIPFEVVPGVTSPLGIAAYAGIPLTHRSHTSVVTFVTGHEPEHIDWSKVGQAETLVILMGLTAFAEISRRMIENGRNPETPAAVVRWGTRPDQETIVGTLASLPGIIEQNGMKPPATFIVGEVVAMREKLNWYEHLPLFGQKIIVTRAREQAIDFIARLHALGAATLELPAIRIEPISWSVNDLGSYRWVIFTSVNGVRHFFDRIVDVREIRGRICAIGPATRAAIEAMHLKVDLIGDEYVAESLLRAFESHPVEGQRILLARAESARDLLPDGLRRRGAHVDVVPVYRTVEPEASTFGDLSQACWITFTSSSTVTNTVKMVGIEALMKLKIASIGPVTSATIRNLGLRVDAEAAPYTVEGLIQAIIPPVRSSEMSTFGPTVSS
jgi:uroporphyrinogen III methyltransferase / synthase